jgi:tRNA A-37 threonylcarbamoyl transferase component Bud32/GAF domain-containing protein
MNSERWRQIDQLFEAALERRPDERPAFLSAACGGDESLRLEVESLLRSDEAAESFIEEPAVALVAEAIAGQPAPTTSQQLDDASFEALVGPSRPFLWFVWISSVIIAAVFAYAACLLVQKGGASVALGWSEARRGDGWFVSRVDPAGPAAGRIESGDRIINMNGAPPIGSAGTEPHRRELAPGQTYEITVERAGQRQTMSLGAAAGPSVLTTRLAYFVTSLLWCFIGLWVGAARPDRPLAQLATATAVTVGLVFLTVGFFEFGTLWAPLHVVVGYHFFSRFPTGAPPRGLWKAILYPLYLLGGIAAASRLAFDGVLLARGLSEASRFPALLSPWDVLALPVFTVSVIAMMAVLAYNYRRLTTEDERRRVRWVLFASLVALAPEIWYAAVDTFERTVGPAPVSRLDLVANLAPVVIPVSVAYAIVKHSVFDIRVAIRLGVQYLLARRALQTLVFLPIIALACSLVINRRRTLEEIVTESAAYIYWMGAATLSLWFRRPIQRWLDRRFFREEYDRDQVLLSLLDEVSKVDSIPGLSRLVIDKVQAALHPKTVYLWYRDSNEFGAASSSNPELTPPDFPAGAWLSWLAEHNEAIDLPLPPAARMIGPEARWLRAREIRLIIPILDGSERLVAVLLLGEKKSEQAYSVADRRLLKAVAKQTAATRENLSLRAMVSEEQRIRHDVLSKLDARLPDLLKECPYCGACYDGAAEVCSRDGAPLTLPLPLSRVLEKRYRLDQLIGRGGMGAVYEARDLQLDRAVAVKILLSRDFGDPKALRRFHREARAAARLNHPNIICVYDFGPVEGEGAYLVMERIYGITLRAVLERDRALAPARAADLFAQLLDGIAAAHAEGVVHRDLKPGNVIAQQAGSPAFRVKILDFGLAKLDSADRLASDSMTAPGAVMGTLGYMSPEQLLGGEVDHRADLFAIGVMLVEVLTGRRPLQGDNYGELSGALLHDTFHLPRPTPEAVALDAILQRCLAKEARDRVSSAAELRRELIPALRKCGSI